LVSLVHGDAAMTIDRARLRHWAPRFALAAGALGALTFAAACSATNDAAPARTNETSDADAGSDAAARGAGAEALFRALEPDLTKTCGGTNGACHVSGKLLDAPAWLAPPDAYRSAKAHRGIVPADNDLEHSILLTQIEHTGPALVNSPDLYARVREWIAAEVNDVKAPESDAFAIDEGFNTVDLAKALAGLDGARLVFKATTKDAILTLTEMRITGPKTQSLHIVNPYFVILPERGPVIVDPTNGFSGELTVAPGQTNDLFGGILVIPKWKTGSKLQIAFQAISLETPPPPSTVGLCKSVASFTASAVPAFKADLGGGATCLGCHGGGDDVAMNAMDLSAVGTNDARACSQALQYVNVADRPNSQLITTPMGKANPEHPIKNASSAFSQAILDWIKNE
jgi:hypothetical protein